jgi:GxxExxY protein
VTAEPQRPSAGADLVAERQVIVEVKTGLVLDPVSKPQLLNYLRAADLSLGLVIHFAPTGAVIKRVVASPEYRSRWKYERVAT